MDESLPNVMSRLGRIKLSAADVKGKVNALGRFASRLGGSLDSDNLAGTQLIHGDCWAPNCVVTNVHGEWSFGGFVDFDHAASGAPILDCFRMFTRGFESGRYYSVTELRPPVRPWRQLKRGYDSVTELPELDPETAAPLLFFYLYRTIAYYLRMIAVGSVGRDQVERFVAILECCSELSKNPQLAQPLRHLYGR
jgi:Ser/Thr protein kinase RdoA (MazF antagonist)